MLFEGVCVPKLPSSLPRRARKGGPKGLIVHLGRAASAALKRYVFQDSMRVPVRRSSLGHFFAKTELPLERCRKVFALCDTSRAGAAFLTRNASRSSPRHFFRPFRPSEKKIFAREVSSKSRPLFLLWFCKQKCRSKSAVFPRWEARFQNGMGISS